MQGKKKYAEKLFTSFQLSNHVPADNFYRLLKESLELQWLYKSTKSYYGREGQQSIDPIVFFKLILIGYLENLNSDRKIIEHSKLRLDIYFSSGMTWMKNCPGTALLAAPGRCMERKYLKSCLQKFFHYV
jgi:transposase